MFGQQSTGLFGNTAPFGQPAQQSLFGQQQTQQPLFGGAQQSGFFGNTGTNTAASGGGGLFGAKPSGGLFGSTPTPAIGTHDFVLRDHQDLTVQGRVQCILSQKEVADRGKSLEQLRLEDYTGQPAFGPAQAAAPTSPFGQTNTNMAGGGGLFGQQQPQSGGGLFGNTTTTGGSLFGQASPTTTTTTGLFGTSPQPTGGLFGQTSSPTQNTGGGLFGNTANTSGGLFGNASSTGGLFGQQKPATGGGLFGNTNTTGTGGLFGNTTATTNTTGGGLFGNTSTTGGGLFGNTTTPSFGGSGGGLFGTTTTSPNTGGGLFGNTNTSNTGGGLFGNQQKPAGGGLFGTTTNTGGGLFSQTSPNTNTTGGLFGNSPQPSGGGLFGNTTSPTQNTGGGLFGNTTGTTNTTGGLFGNSNTTGGGLFGQKPATTGGGLFGNTTTTGGGGLFGASQNSPSTNTGGGLFGNTSTAGGGLFGSKPANTGGGLFGNTSTAGGGLFGSKPATTTGGGLFGNTTNTTNTTGGGLFGNTTGGGLFGNANTTNTTGGGLFGNANKTNTGLGTTGGLFGTGSTTPQPNQVTNQPCINPNTPLLSSSVSDTYHLSRLALGNAAKLIWGGTSNFTVSPATRTRPSLLGATDLAGTAWKPAPRVSYIDTVAQQSSARTPQPATRNESRNLADTTPAPMMTSRGGEDESRLTSQRASEPGPRRRTSQLYLDTMAAQPGSTTSRHFEPLPIPTNEESAAGEEDDITPWMPASESLITARRHSQGTTPCLTPKRSTTGCLSARRSPSSFQRVPNDLAPKCSDPEIECRPSIQAMERFTEAELTQVLDFTVIHANHGSIMWPGYTDVRGLDIDNTVEIMEGAVEVYGRKWFEQQYKLRGQDATVEEPPVGEGLNKEAIVTLHNCRAVDEDDSYMSHEEALAAQREVLKDYAAKMDAEFISLSNDWTWKFKVAHFSRYALPGKATLVSHRGQRSASSVTSVATKQSATSLGSKRLGVRKIGKAKVMAEKQSRFPVIATSSPPISAISISSLQSIRPLQRKLAMRMDLDKKSLLYWSQTFQTPEAEVDIRHIQLALLQTLESFELNGASRELKSLFSLALSVTSKGHTEGFFPAIGSWLFKVNNDFLTAEENGWSKATKADPLDSALLHILANQTTTAATLLMSPHVGLPRLSFLVEAVGVRMMPETEVLQQLESFHKLKLADILNPGAAKILHLLAGNVDRTMLSMMPAWHFSLAAILWFELSANLIASEDPQGNCAPHSATLELALDKLSREAARETHKAGLTMLSKPLEILYLRCLVDVKSGLRSLAGETLERDVGDIFVPVILSLVAHTMKVYRKIKVKELICQFPEAVNEGDDATVSRLLYSSLTKMFDTHYKRIGVAPETFLWKILVGLLCDVGVATILDSVEELAASYFKDTPLESLVSARAVGVAGHQEVETLNYLEDVLGCPRVFVVVSLARSSYHQKHFVKASTYWLSAYDLQRKAEAAHLGDHSDSNTWWSMLTNMASDVMSDYLPSADQCVSESLTSLVESGEVGCRLRRVAALVTPLPHCYRCPPDSLGESEMMQVLWRLKTESMDALSLDFIDKILPYDIVLSMETIQSIVDLVKVKYVLDKDGSSNSVISSTLSSVPSPSKSQINLVSAWYHSHGDGLLEILRWLLLTLQVVSFPTPTGDPLITLSLKGSCDITKFLPSEYSLQDRFPETLSMVAHSKEASSLDSVYAKWLADAVRLRELCGDSSHHQVFGDFKTLIERVIPSDVEIRPSSAVTSELLGVDPLPPIPGLVQ